MKILWLSPSDMITEWMLGSIDCLNEHDVHICRYDRVGQPVDRGVLNFADRVRPDVILYISQAAGPYVAQPSTFLLLRNIAPVVHLCFDAGDVGFSNLLTEYKEKQCFDVTVACDGCNIGPVDLVLFHPVDPRPYEIPLERDIPLGTCGGFPYGLRRDVSEHLIRTCGLLIKPREEWYGSYGRYADFLKRCRIVLDCALSAGGHEGKGPYTRTLKTRAIEVGLAGACLLELRGCALSKYAIEDVDYVTYETKEEAADKASDLIRDRDMASAIAKRLHDKVVTTMSPKVFWNQVWDYLRAHSQLAAYHS